LPNGDLSGAPASPPRRCVDLNFAAKDHGMTSPIMDEALESVRRWQETVVAALDRLLHRALRLLPTIVAAEYSGEGNGYRLTGG
jgi:hypothetical protein